VITDPNATVLAVPQESLIIFAGVKKVYLLDGDKIRESLVQTGAQSEKLVEIVSGVKAEDKVAVSNLIRLAEGVRVREAAAVENAPGPGSPSPEGTPRKRKRG
jgi:hypothetical protein